MKAAGLWQSEGKTPDATVSARLYADIKANGEKSPFTKAGPMTFALRDFITTLDDTDATPSDTQIGKT